MGATRTTTPAISSVFADKSLAQDPNYSYDGPDGEHGRGLEKMRVTPSFYLSGNISKPGLSAGYKISEKDESRQFYMRRNT